MYYQIGTPVEARIFTPNMVFFVSRTGSYPYAYRGLITDSCIIDVKSQLLSSDKMLFTGSKLQDAFHRIIYD